MIKFFYDEGEKYYLVGRVIGTREVIDELWIINKALYEKYWMDGNFCVRRMDNTHTSYHDKPGKNITKENFYKSWREFKLKEKMKGVFND